ncbi:hypothetical protein BKA93DRAFT_826263 [Sparassis latifolia]
MVFELQSAIRHNYPPDLETWIQKSINNKVETLQADADEVLSALDISHILHHYDSHRIPEEIMSKIVRIGAENGIKILTDASAILDTFIQRDDDDDAIMVFGKLSPLKDFKHRLNIQEAQHHVIFSRIQRTTRKVLQIQVDPYLQHALLDSALDAYWDIRTRSSACLEMLSELHLQLQERTGQSSRSHVS